MPTLHFWIGFAFCVALLVGVLELVRRRKLSERYSLLWLASAAVGLLLLILYKPLFMKLVKWLGVKNPPTLLFIVAFFFLMLIVLHYSLVITKLSARTRELAQKVAMFEETLARGAGDEKDTT